MTQTFFTSRGEQIQIGRELGRGGEGSVFEVPSSSNQVAKIYHQNKLPDNKKQEKLRFMVEASDTPLIKHISWPQETLHYSRGGSVVGFLMPNVSGKKPVHMVYSPAYRRQAYPNKSWEFLLCIARNIAASFDTLHSHQHIIGDVNENSIMVGDDAKVVLIDSDSFQINERGVLHLCEVGVPNYTAPELQNQSSFKGIHRTVNHDNFGLALLIFHVLFGGRHPYAGIPLQDCVGESLDIDIKNLRYAYARDHTSRGFKPPPRSIPVSILPDEAEAMFHRAFTEEGKKGNRPTAKEWVTTLDAIRKNLKKCTTSPSMHIYPQHLAACPWCEIERQQGAIYFIDLGISFVKLATHFNVQQVLMQINDPLDLPLFIYSKPRPILPKFNIDVPQIKIPNEKDFSNDVIAKPILLSNKSDFYTIAPFLALLIILLFIFSWPLALIASALTWIYKIYFDNLNKKDLQEISKQNHERKFIFDTKYTEYCLLVEKTRSQELIEKYDEICILKNKSEFKLKNDDIKLMDYMESSRKEVNKKIYKLRDQIYKERKQLNTYYDFFKKNQKEYDVHKSRPVLEQKEIDKFNTIEFNRQKKDYLSRQLIEDANIYLIGDYRKRNLYSAGIYTAADVTQDRVRMAAGFGDELTNIIMGWRSSLEKNFIFSPNLTTGYILPLDKNNILHQCNLRNNDISNKINESMHIINSLKNEVLNLELNVNSNIDKRIEVSKSNINELFNEFENKAKGYNLLRQEVERNIFDLKSDLEKAAKDLAQAEKDLAMVHTQAIEGKELYKNQHPPPIA